jgi:hypothetical protein
LAERLERLDGDYLNAVDVGGTTATKGIVGLLNDRVFLGLKSLVSILEKVVKFKWLSGLVDCL